MSKDDLLGELQMDSESETENDPMYLAPKELAMKSGYSAKTIRKFLRNGVIVGIKPSRKSNGQWRIPKCSLRHFLETLEAMRREHERR